MGGRTQLLRHPLPLQHPTPCSRGSVPPSHRAGAKTTPAASRATSGSSGRAGPTTTIGWRSQSARVDGERRHAVPFREGADLPDRLREAGAARRCPGQGPPSRPQPLQRGRSESARGRQGLRLDRVGGCLHRRLHRRRRRRDHRGDRLGLDRGPRAPPRRTAPPAGPRPAPARRRIRSRAAPVRRPVPRVPSRHRPAGSRTRPRRPLRRRRAASRWVSVSPAATCGSGRHAARAGPPCAGGGPCPSG